MDDLNENLWSSFADMIAFSYSMHHKETFLSSQDTEDSGFCSQYEGKLIHPVRFQKLAIGE